MGTIAQKLQKLLSTKAGIKNAINGSGSTVGDNFSEYPTAITDGKAYIAEKITAKGVATSADATFQQMGDNVSAIETGGGDPEFVYIGIQNPYGNTQEGFSFYYTNEKGVLSSISIADVLNIHGGLAQLTVKPGSIIQYLHNGVVDSSLLQAASSYPWYTTSSSLGSALEGTFDENGVQYLIKAPEDPSVAGIIIIG